MYAPLKESKVLLTLPGKNEELRLLFNAACIYIFTFALDAVLFDKEDTALCFSGEGRGTVFLENFFAAGQEGQGFFVTQDGDALHFQDVRRAFDSVDGGMIVG